LPISNHGAKSGLYDVRYGAAPAAGNSKSRPFTFINASEYPTPPAPNITRDAFNVSS
jgi:hypothetical protein